MLINHGHASALRVRPYAPGQERKSRMWAQKIARLALRSLYEELVLYPKPGLVSLRDNGSHQDMNAQTFMRSLFSLRRYFKAICLAGADGADFDALKQLGIAAEKRMLLATGDINTHRGAIFALGMLCAAAGHCLQTRQALTTDHLRHTLTSLWGAALLHHSAALTPDANPSHGQQAAQRYQVSGAREEAAMGFPSIFELALLRLQKTLEEGRDFSCAQIDTLFVLMAHISDTNLYHRGGEQGIAFVQQTARRFMDDGGTAQTKWIVAAQACHQQFVARRLSPGGAADLLAATCFVHWCTTELIEAS
ncbi:triphosphoribosyl-dephospho-CoA synthase MdcB [Undibacterium sp. TJN19]|uniref:triphosphoribosyl-dephospho-CoA synthase MdcB n=1 Tax=Undibacterium sp. TJN19 TaxID=3413055 RepID=UPI003BF0469F